MTAVALPPPVLPNQRDLPSLIKWVEMISVSHSSQGYSAVSIVIQQRIEPIIRQKGPRIELGEVLSSGIAECKGFANQLKALPSTTLDPVFFPILTGPSHEIPASAVATKKVEKVTTVSRAISFVWCDKKDHTSLKLMYQSVLQEILKIQESMKGTLSIFAQAFVSNKLLCFPQVTNSSGQSFPETAQLERIQRMIGRDFNTPNAGECVFLEKHFDHGEIERSKTRLSILLEAGEVRTTTKKKSNTSKFTDLRYESESTFRLS